VLFLYDWSSVDGAYITSDERLDIPFVLSFNDDLRQPPDRVPDLPPFQVGVIEKGEEVYPEDYHVFVEGVDFTCLQFTVNHLTRLLERTRAAKANWEFVDVALMFYREACFSSAGFVQLLWLIITIECLLGKKGPGSTERLKSRLTSIFATTTEEHHEVSNFFAEIYSLRSDLVHGNTALLKISIDDERLRRLHEFARGTVVWFLHYLDYVLEHQSRQFRNTLPKREELLSVLDNPSDLAGVKWLRSMLPPHFPRIIDWLDPRIHQPD
jgi:hypothetical protein